MVKSVENTSYKDAIKRLEEIVESIENQELDIDVLASQVKEANTLISICSKKLNAVNTEVEKLLEDNKD